MNPLLKLFVPPEQIDALSAKAEDASAQIEAYAKTTVALQTVMAMSLVGILVVLAVKKGK